MKWILVCLLSACNLAFSEEVINANPLNISEIMQSFENVDKSYIKLSDGTFIVYFLEEGEVKGVTRLDPQNKKGFFMEIENLVTANPERGIDYITCLDFEVSLDADGDVVSKTVPEVYSESYYYDQLHRLLRYNCFDVEVHFLYRDKMLTVISTSCGDLEAKSIFMLDECALGELDRFVLKDLSGKIILVLLDDKPYLPVLDEHGSMIEVLDPDTRESIARVTFSETGHVLETFGDKRIPICYKGMMQEKLTELFIDIDKYYDADIERYLANSSY